MAAASGGAEPSVNIEVGGVVLQEGNEPPPARPDVSNHPDVHAATNVATFPRPPLAPPKNRPPGATVAAASGGEEPPVVTVAPGVFQHHAADVATNVVAAFPPPPLAPCQECPPGWSTASKPPLPLNP